MKSGDVEQSQAIQKNASPMSTGDEQDLGFLRSQLVDDIRILL